MNTGHTNINDLLDLNDFNPNNEKEQYKGFHENVDKYEGEFKDGKKHGRGIYYESGRVEYDGEFKDGKMHGQVTKYYKNGNKEYEGKYKDDKMHGQGTYYYENGKKCFRPFQIA